MDHKGTRDRGREGPGQFWNLYFLSASIGGRKGHIGKDQNYEECVMSSASEQLQSKLSDQENEKKRNRIFLSDIMGHFVTWIAIAATYASLQSETPNAAAWGAIMFALFGLHVGLAVWKTRN